MQSPDIGFSPPPAILLFGAKFELAALIRSLAYRVGRFACIVEQASAKLSSPAEFFRHQSPSGAAIKASSAEFGSGTRAKMFPLEKIA